MSPRVSPSLLERSFDLPFGYRATFIWRRPDEPFEVRWSLTNHAFGSRARSESFLRPTRPQGASSSKSSARLEANGYREQVASGTGDGAAGGAACHSWRRRNRRGLALAPYRFGLAVVRRPRRPSKRPAEMSEPPRQRRPIMRARNAAVKDLISKSCSAETAGGRL